MTDPNDEANDPNNDGIRSALQASIGDGRMVTDFFAVFEAVDDEGAYWFFTRSSDQLLPWRAKGMLQHAADVVIRPADDEED